MGFVQWMPSFKRVPVLLLATSAKGSFGWRKLLPARHLPCSGCCWGNVVLHCCHSDVMFYMDDSSLPEQERLVQSDSGMAYRGVQSRRTLLIYDVYIP